MGTERFVVARRWGVGSNGIRQLDEDIRLFTVDLRRRAFECFADDLIRLEPGAEQKSGLPLTSSGASDDRSQ